ncbi:hypothetical protein ACHAWF_002340 [Thalassiosira exigua]
MNKEAEAEALKAEGNKLVGAKDWAGAAEKYGEAIACDPTKAAYYSNLALCHEKLGDIASFKNAALKCIEVDPTFTKGYYRLAKAHGILWEYGHQVDVLERGLAAGESNKSDLQKMVRIAKTNLDHITGFDEVLLDQSESDPHPEFLGGVISSNIPHTTYSKLKRRHHPPLADQLRSNLMRCDEKARPVIESFCGGTLKTKWFCPTDDSIEVDGYLPNETVPVISYKGKRMPMGFGNGFQTAQHPTYDKTLSSEEKQYLCIVMMLRFIAAKGSQLVMKDEVISEMVEGVIKMCTQHGLYNDIVYAQITLADISFSKGYDKKIFKVIKTAEALEAAKRYQEAGDIYCEVTDPDKFTQHPSAPSKVLHGYAGLAFKRAQDYVSAEREYVAALRESGPDWASEIRLGAGFHISYDDGHTADTLENMLIFYEIVHRAVTSGLKTDKEHKRMQRACHLLVGLLSIAGYQNDGNTMFIHPKQTQLCQDALKPECKRNPAAMNAVVHATMAPTIDIYHQRLLDCMVYDEYHFVSLHSNPEQEEMQSDLLRDQKP